MKQSQEYIIPEKMKMALEALAGVKNEDIEYTSRGLRFNFSNSLVANYCQIIEYHDDYLVEFRKKSDNIIEGTSNLLVSEKIIKPQELQDHFENLTGIYLSYI